MFVRSDQKRGHGRCITRSWSNGAFPRRVGACRAGPGGWSDGSGRPEPRSGPTDSAAIPTPFSPSKQPGSRNRAKARRKVARLHARVQDARKDALHQITTRLVHENQVLVVEDLAIANLMGSATGTVDEPGRRVRQKAGLNRAIADASWGELIRQLHYKARWYGRTVVVVDRFFPSTRRCAACHAVDGGKDLSVRSWTCPHCGAELDRDTNAAANLRTEGLRLYWALVRGLPPGKSPPAVIRHPGHPPAA
ncbi:RNA-guided endonuclease InsQ/TnpB family protein [Streptomyces sp. RKAG337]|uniref:RNA-guided endonuclease InsQ/TnpB family protein n=1 Tax=Streptomyces sp. RKAG337 TaxID=2893404 RepID=UPI0027E4F83E|nr:RNA-guided endonuclease TnpB family protein [Streptomyces sp. RKAG337]